MGTEDRRTDPVHTRWQLTRAGGYALAIASSVAVVWLRVRLAPHLGDKVPFVTAIFAVVLTGWIADVGAMVLALVLSGAGTWFFVLQPGGAAATGDIRNLWALGGYLFVGFSFALFARQYRAANESADAAVRMAKEALRQRDQELVQRQTAESALRKANSDLEQKVLERTEELARSKALLETAHAQLVSALAVGGMGVWSVDAATKTVNWDDTNAKTWGYGDHGMHSLDFTALSSQRIHEDDRENVVTQLASLLRNGGSLENEFRIYRPDGEIRWLHSTGTAVRAPDGGIVAITGVTTDITDRRKALEAQGRAQKLEALGTLAGGIAHDFNNILMAIDGNADMASRKLPPDHAARKNLAEIGKAATRASEITRRILSFSRAGTARREVVSLANVLADALELLRAALPANVRLRTDVPDDSPCIDADPTQVQQVILNLVTNAARAIDDNGRVEVRVRRETVDASRDGVLAALPEGDYAVLEVRDDGCGIQPDILDRIFDPFFTTSAQGEGTGLGLWVVKGIVRSHGGEVTVESSPGHGSTFRVLLPAVEAQPATDAAEDATKCSGSGERVLFVDDEEAIVELMAQGLGNKGFRVTARALPEHALRDFLLAPAAFDALVTDLSMPNISGFEMTRHVLEERPDLPVILMSGYLKPEDQQRASALGVREVLQKPASIDEVACALRRAIDQRPQACG